MLDEVTISRAILRSYFDKLDDGLKVDVAIVGGGPSGLVAGYYLAKAGRKVALFERRLSVGGGLWGGGMMFNAIVVQEAGRELLAEFDLAGTEYRPGYYVLDSVDVTSTLIHRAVRAGLRIFNLVAMEDVVIKQGRVAGLVINWGAVDTLKWPVDPLTLHATYVIDGTGHPARVAEVLVRKMGVALKTGTGGIAGERSMQADEGEAQTVANTTEIYPGLFVCGMAANAVHGGYRMGPVFGGMLLSGRKAAQEILARL